jgi:hypothetical protein
LTLSEIDDAVVQIYKQLLKIYLIPFFQMAGVVLFDENPLNGCHSSKLL